MTAGPYLRASAAQVCEAHSVTEAAEPVSVTKARWRGSELIPDDRTTGDQGSQLNDFTYKCHRRRVPYQPLQRVVRLLQERQSSRPPTERAGMAEVS
jgi:hypothetical protein